MSPSSLVRTAARLYVSSGFDSLTVTLLAIVGVVLGAADAPEGLVALPFGLALLVAFGLSTRYWRAWNTRAVRPSGFLMAGRIIAALVPMLAYAGAPRDTDPLVYVAGLLLALGLAFEQANVPLADAAIPVARHFPGIRIRNYPVFRVPYLFYIDWTFTAIAGVLGFLRAPLPLFVIACLVPIVANLVLAIDAITRITARKRIEAGLAATFRAYAPEFIVHWDAPIGGGYQLTMWLPLLKRLNKPFVVVVRNQGTFSEIARATDVPVILRKSTADIEAMPIDELGTVFYVNTALRNNHLVRFPQLMHIQLNHGDSDKGPSYSPTFRMFDRNFVAGQAAIDRFEKNGVEVPREAFEIVGRPQVEAVQVRHSTTRPPEPTVLYAPTWSGFFEDANYSSLEQGPAIIRALIERGCRVVFRPHPFARKNPELRAGVTAVIELLRQDRDKNGRQHIWGTRAESTMSIFDCFNESNAMISDVSSVVADYLFSEKPFAVCSMLPEMSGAEFTADFPLARAAYVLEHDMENLDAVLDDLLAADPLAERRQELKAYYLGDFSDVAYAEHFLQTARRYIERDAAAPSGTAHALTESTESADTELSDTALLD